MSIFVVIMIAIGLSMDAFTVAVTAGIILPKITTRHYFRLSFHFGLFQALMPMFGWLAGQTIVDYVELWDHWIAFGLLFFIGSKMIYEAQHSIEDRQISDPTRGLRLVSLSLATSIDALAVGLSLAMVNVEIVYPAIIIGFITMILTFVGMKLGEKIGPYTGQWAGKIGGIVLIGIGLKIIIESVL